MEVFMSHYRNAPLTLKVDAPSDLGVPAVGHMGHFKAGALAAFVPRVSAWANERLSERN
jgi:predicted alpha/beta hydrolase